MKNKKTKKKLTRLPCQQQRCIFDRSQSSDHTGAQSVSHLIINIVKKRIDIE